MSPSLSRVVIRIVDLAVAIVLAPVWLPLLLLGLAAAATQGFPIFYRADRIGRDGKTFRMLKLRSMVPNAAQLGAPVSASDDPRITPVGKLLRRTKLDELPQFLHVLSGRMSIGGPRPEAPDYLRYYTPAGLRSLEAKPGITGYGALYFFSAERDFSSADFEERYLRELLATKLLLDERCWLDLQARPVRTTLSLLALTISSVLFRRSTRLSPAQMEARFLR